MPKALQRGPAARQCMVLKCGRGSSIAKTKVMLTIFLLSSFFNIMSKLVFPFEKVLVLMYLNELCFELKEF